MGTGRWLQAVILFLVFLLVEQSLAAGTIAHQQWRDYAWPDPGVSNADPVSREQTSVDWVWDESPGRPAFHYDYQPLRIRSGDPAHNGHLHRVSLGMGLSDGRWRLRGRLGLHGTSNIFKHREPHRDAVVGKVVLWRRLDGAPVQAVGVGGDHRFGHFRWLPRFLWEGSVAGHGLRLELPRGFYWQSPDKRWRFRVERLGDKWGALDAGREFKSAIYLEEWQLVLSRRFPAFAGDGVLEAGLGVSLDTRVRYRETDQREVRRELGNAGFGLVQLRW